MPRSAETTWAQRAAMLDWLSFPENFKLITDLLATKNKQQVVAGGLWFCLLLVHFATDCPENLNLSCS